MPWNMLTGRYKVETKTAKAANYTVSKSKNKIYKFKIFK